MNQKTKSELCIECQECCKTIKMPNTGFLSFHARTLYEARGFTISTEDGNVFIVIPHTCQHLTPEGCAIYNTRPQACKVYDGRTDPTVNCRWKELEEENHD